MAMNHREGEVFNRNAAGYVIGHGQSINSTKWKEMVRQKEVPRQYLNELVMEYLVTEGYRDAAMHFQQESGTEPGVDLRTVEERVQIRKAVMAGELAKAMGMANDMNTMVLNRNRHEQPPHLSVTVRVKAGKG
ncbi:unnamed protein product [Discosporangium mesarthrocarpum]